MILHACLDCGTPSDRPRCPLCRRAREQDRPSAARRGYGHAHRTLRETELQDRPWCEGTEHGDELVPATQVHHRDGDQGNNSLANLMPVCAHCHGTIEASQRRTRDEQGRWAA